MLILLIPWMLLIIVLLSMVFFFRKKWVYGTVLFIIGFLINHWFECVALNVFTSNTDCRKRCIKVLSFNVDASTITGKKKIPLLANFIKEKGVDAAFILEVGGGNKMILDSLLKECFQYSTCDIDLGYDHCLFSKYPIENWHKIYRKGDETVGAYSCSLILDKDTIDLIGCHFASNNYTENKEYLTPDSLKSYLDLHTYINDIQIASQHRNYEAEIVKEEILLSTHPIIVMGDFNDVGGSKPIKTLESSGLKDAWWKGGVGYGATIHHPLPYRIDRIMFSSQLTLKSIKIENSNGLSDHNALFAAIEY